MNHEERQKVLQLHKMEEFVKENRKTLNKQFHKSMDEKERKRIFCDFYLQNIKEIHIDKHWFEEAEEIWFNTYGVNTGKTKNIKVIYNQHEKPDKVLSVNKTQMEYIEENISYIEIKNQTFVYHYETPDYCCK